MMLDARQVNSDGQITLGADKGYDAAEFIEALQDIKVTPHIENKSAKTSAVPNEIATTEGYAISQQKRKFIEQGFGWGQTYWPCPGRGARARSAGRSVVNRHVSLSGKQFRVNVLNKLHKEKGPHREPDTSIPASNPHPPLSPRLHQTGHLRCRRHARASQG